MLEKRNEIFHGLNVSLNIGACTYMYIVITSIILGNILGNRMCFPNRLIECQFHVHSDVQIEDSCKLICSDCQ